MHARWFRFAFIALAPVALLAGILVQIHIEQPTWPDHVVSTTRKEAIANARSFLLTRGVDVSGWRAYCGGKEDKDLFRLQDQLPAQEHNQLVALFPPVTVQVVFRSADGSHMASVRMGLDKHVTAWDIHASGIALPTQPQSAPESLDMAQAILAADPVLRNIFQGARPEVSTSDRADDTVTRMYLWRTPVGPKHEIEGRFSLSIRNGRVIARQLEGSLDPDFAARNFHSGETAIALLAMLYFVYVSVVAIYSLFSYGRRATQKEVSHSRTLLVTLLAWAVLLVIVFTGIDDTLMNQGKDRPIPVAFIFTLMALLTGGVAILAGVAYGSGEGDVRESYPGKLTSLDALTLGKVFSRNVGSSVTAGAIFASWLYLFSNLLRLPFATSAAADSLGSIHLLFMNSPQLALLMVSPVIGLLLAITGLLEPLAISTRLLSNPKVRVLIVCLCSALAAMGVAAGKPSASAFLIAVLITVPAIVVPFFLFDFLASLVCVTAGYFTQSLVGLAVVSPPWRDFAWMMASLAAVTLAVEFWASRKGRLWQEEKVRPEYARHIAERQSLQEEVSAAREAQLRLLPKNPPAIPGISIAAACLPARTVGGDFYDFFPLSGERLGIFIAEGGSLGLASALTIALAKGYLMYSARRYSSPAEVIQRLEAALGPLLAAGSLTTTVAYAVVDPLSGTLEYARTGTFPKVIVARHGGSAPQLESELREQNGDRVFWKGQVHLAEGDTIYFYTDGVAKRIAGRSTLLQDDWLRRLANTQPDATALHRSLFESLGAHTTKPAELDDDLTAIVIRFTGVGEVFQEVVA